jgi:hypothetical protein
LFLRQVHIEGVGDFLYTLYMPGGVGQRDSPPIYTERLLSFAKMWLLISIPSQFRRRNQVQNTPCLGQENCSRRLNFILTRILSLGSQNQQSSQRLCIYRKSWMFVLLSDRSIHMCQILPDDYQCHHRLVWSLLYPHSADAHIKFSELFLVFHCAARVRQRICSFVSDLEVVTS